MKSQSLNISQHMTGSLYVTLLNPHNNLMLDIVILIIELNFFKKEKIQRGLKIVHYLFEHGIACF